MRHAIGRTVVVVVGIALVGTAFGGGAAVGRRTKNNPFVAKAVGRITVETRGPSATGYGITDVSQPVPGVGDAVCIDTSRPVSVAVATAEDDNGSAHETSVAIPPPPGRCAESSDIYIRLHNAPSGGTLFFVAY